MRGGGLIGPKVNMTRETAPGVFDLVDQQKLRNTSWPQQQVGFSTYNTSFSVKENGGYLFGASQFVYEGYAPGTSVVFTAAISHITTTSTDFTGLTGNDIGNFTMLNGVIQGNYPAYFTRFRANPSLGNRTFKIVVKDNATGAIIWTSAILTLEAPTLLANSWSVSSIAEGGTAAVYTLKYGNLQTYGSITYAASFVGTASGADVSGGLGTGALTVSASGELTIINSVTAVTDGSEGDQTLIYSTVFTSAAIANTAVVSPTLTIIDGVASATVTPSTTTATEGTSLTFSITSNQASGTTLYYSFAGNGLTANDFTDQLLTGSFVTITNGAGSFSKILTADGISESKSFTCSIRTGSVTGTIAATSSAITMVDAAKLTRATGTTQGASKALVYGNTSYPTWPPPGWISVVNAGADDAFAYVPFSFSFRFNDVNYQGCYVGSNHYITFGTGSTVYTSLSAVNPPLNKICMGASDNSYLRVAYYNDPAGTFCRIRFEGNTAAGSPTTSNCFYEMTFYSNLSDSQGWSRMELITGGVDTNGLSGLYSATGGLTGGTFTITANTSWVMYATNAAATTWGINSNSYWSDQGY